MSTTNAGSTCNKSINNINYSYLLIKYYFCGKRLIPCTQKGSACRLVVAQSACYFNFKQYYSYMTAHFTSPTINYYNMMQVCHAYTYPALDVQWPLITCPSSLHTII